jgi:multisubunit Na+/H+ antiporter MnhG subunit
VTARTVGADLLLGLAIALVLGSSVGVLVMRDVYQKIHFVTPAALVAPLVVGLAVLVQSGIDIVTAQTWLVLLFVAIAGPVLAHATIRAARIRDKGDWRSGRGEASSQASSRRAGSGGSRS